jgi:hypothetical protein
VKRAIKNAAFLGIVGRRQDSPPLPPHRPPWYIPGVDDRKTPLWLWIVALLIGLPVVYVASSGPTQSLAFRSRIVTIPVPPDSLIGYAEIVVDQGRGWPRVYAPLLWASEEPWGEVLENYWALFPIQGDK